MAIQTLDPLSREIPAWFDAAKLGIFVHWSPAAIPAFAPKVLLDDLPDDPDWVKAWRRLPFAEMYQNTMVVPGSATARYHAEQYGELPYDAFVERFRDEMIPRWDPEPWAELFSQSGAGYVVFTTKTEDGFCFWPSAHPHPRRRNWQSERDVVGELAQAVRAHGVRFGTYYCGGVDWTFGGLPMTSAESLLAGMPQDDEYIALFDAHWRELIERYEPCVLWNDYGRPEREDPEPLIRLYLERVTDGIVNDRFDNEVLRSGLESRRGDHRGDEPRAGAAFSDFVTVEYATDGPDDRKWEACRGMGTSFGYNRQECDADYLTATELIHLFVDVVARGGNLLINVGPTATGDIPWAQAQRLLELGRWLKLNHGAIYGTRRWERPHGVTDEGLPIRYTASDDAVHATVLGTPTTASVEIDVRLAEGTEVTLEGRRGALPWSASPAGVRVELAEVPDVQPALSLRLAPGAAVRDLRE